MGHWPWMCTWVGGTARVGRGPFPRGRWLHNHSEIKGNEGHDGDKWQFLRIRCVWLLKLQYGSICYSWNSLQSKQCSCIKGTAQSWETSKFSVLFPQAAISSWKYPPLRWIWHTSHEFLRIRIHFPPETERQGGFQSRFEDQVQLTWFWVGTK